MTESIKEYKKQKYFNKDIGEIEAIQFDGTVECAHAIFYYIDSFAHDEHGTMEYRYVDVVAEKISGYSSIIVEYNIRPYKRILLGYKKWIWIDKDKNVCAMINSKFVNKFKLVE